MINNTTTLEEQLAAERDRYLRLAAEFENFRKRTARDLDRRAAAQKESVVRDLLPSIDNLERALAAGPGGELQDGIRMVHQQMVETLKRHGFEPREDLGQAFDGRFHDAIAVGFNPDLPEHAVIEVWERGWMRGQDLFRPAKVLVNKVDAPTPSESNTSGHGGSHGNGNGADETGREADRDNLSYVGHNG